MPERLFHFFVDASEHGPYPGLVDPRNTMGLIGPYCSPAFSRSTAEQIVADLHKDNCGMTARWDGEVLTFDWTPDYDGEGGTESVTPDERGLYRIGGHWPWDYDGPLDATERHQAALARSAARSTTPVPPTAEPVTVTATRHATTAPGR
ncbi:hypothetical protein OU787_25850 [Kitasatospora sp. YST-16]|uniref:hypothetical protein n=1 Tax=Kitasatospora sp. YST-16 TaxID=2998080 RepID=UPI002283E468|nr:hypothetical protein [Kitasatospora sp. YST-16]WAL74617.1 hypothetical protein OU787_25850 [Kitasatospora sp. YST-16]WNW40675.1 hypothetical protein RKE32_25785 [Streptomyces sp. Li-HN-5-13]